MRLKQQGGASVLSSSLGIIAPASTESYSEIEPETESAVMYPFLTAPTEVIPADRPQKAAESPRYDFDKTVPQSAQNT